MTGTIPANVRLTRTTHTARLSADITGPLPGLRKICQTGSHPDLHVGMREIEQNPSVASFGTQYNPPIPVYDTSGSYINPEAIIGIESGLPALRADWIAERNDTQVLDIPSSRYGQKRLSDMALDAIRMQSARQPLLSRGGCAVTPMHYARRGITTPEMEYVALREDCRLQEFRTGSPMKSCCNITLEWPSAHTCLNRLPQNSYERKSLPGVPSFLQHQPFGVGADDHRTQFRVKINANIGNSEVTSSIAEEIKKIAWAIRFKSGHRDGYFHWSQHP